MKTALTLLLTALLLPLIQMNHPLQAAALSSEGPLLIIDHSLDIGTDGLSRFDLRERLVARGKVILEEKEQYSNNPSIGFILYQDDAPLGGKSSWYAQYETRNQKILQVYTIFPIDEKTGHTFDRLLVEARKVYGVPDKEGSTPQGRRYGVWYSADKKAMFQVLEDTKQGKSELKVMYKNRPNLHTYKKNQKR